MSIYTIIYTVQVTFKERQKMLSKSYCMIVVSDAPSSKPSPLIHFIVDPLRHKLDARTRANKSLALTNARVSAYDFSNLAAMLLSTCFKKCSASLWRSTSTEVTKGVNVPHLSSTCTVPYVHVRVKVHFN